MSSESRPTQASMAAEPVSPDVATTIVARRLTPSVLGQLIALYEHVVFVQGCVWGIDSFDQWGVELGKELANRITPELTGEAAGDHDPSTAALIEWYRSNRAESVRERRSGG